MPTKKTTTSTKKASTKKKPVAKKSTSKTSKQPKKELVIAPEEKLFWLTTGMTLAHLLDLHQALKDMEDAHYAYHAEGESNDFAEWVELVLCDGECADALRRARTKNGAQRTVGTYIKLYQLD